MKIRFKKKWFNPLYFHLNHYLKNTQIRKILVYGGKSSAKTFSISQLILKELVLHGHSAIVYRKESSQIKTTIKKSFEAAKSSIKLDEGVTALDFIYRSFRGSEIVFRGLDKEGKVKGIEGYKYLLFDELDHFSKAEFDQANLSLRGIKNQKIFATWNPVDSDIWIKQDIDEKQWKHLPRILDNDKYTKLSEHTDIKISEDGKILLVKTNYHDNKWIVGGDGYGEIDEALIQEYEDLKNKNKNLYNVNVLGEWGIVDTSNKFAYAFDEDYHAIPFKDYGIEVDENEPLRISFDFNVNPITAIVGQSDRDQIRIFRAFAEPNSDTEKLCDKIISYYPLGKYIFQVTGDASGFSRDTRSKLNDYQIIKDKFELTPYQVLAPKKNSSIRDSQILCNSILANMDIRFCSEYCKELIDDLKYVTMVENSSKPEIDKKKHGAHSLDNWRYFIQTWHADFLKFHK